MTKGTTGRDLQPFCFLILSQTVILPRVHSTDGVWALGFIAFSAHAPQPIPLEARYRSACKESSENRAVENVRADEYTKEPFEILL